MAQPLRTTGKMARFAELYLRYANATKAAIEAGYNPKHAAQSGSGLLRKPQVRNLIEAKKVNRSVHAEVTYSNMIAVAQASVKLFIDTIQNPTATIWEKCRVTETAGKQLERLGKMEGLILPPIENHNHNQNVNLTLQRVTQIIAQQQQVKQETEGKRIPYMESETVGDAERGGNGNGETDGGGATSL